MALVFPSRKRRETAASSSSRVSQVRDPEAEENASLRNSKGVVERFDASGKIDMTLRAKHLIREAEAASSLVSHLRAMDASTADTSARISGDSSETAAAATPAIRDDDDDDDDASKALARDVSSALLHAERPPAQGDPYFATEHDPATLAAFCGAAAARRVVEQANSDEVAAVFEVLRRRRDVRPYGPAADDACAPVSSPNLCDFYEKHQKTLKKYLFYRDRFLLHKDMTADDVNSGDDASGGGSGDEAEAAGVPHDEITLGKENVL